MRVTKIGQGLVVVGLAVWISSRKSGDTTASAPSSMVAASTAPVAAAAAVARLKKPDSVSASHVAADFSNNEAAAEDRYKDRCLVLTGTVRSVDAGIGKEPTVSLNGGIMGVLVSDVPREWAKTLNRGDAVEIDVDGVDEVLSQPIAKYSAECISARLAFEAEAAKASAAKAAVAPQKGKPKAKGAGAQAKN